MNSGKTTEMLWIVLKELKTGLAQSLNSCNHAYFKYRCPCVFFSPVILFTAWNSARIMENLQLQKSHVYTHFFWETLFQVATHNAKNY